MQAVSLFADLLALFYPTLCLACDEVLVSGERECCTQCRTALPYLSYHLPDPTTAAADSPLARRFWGKVPVQHTLAYLQFSARGRVQQLLHRLKYENQPEIGQVFGRWFGEELSRTGYHALFEGIVPVPMHPSKLRLRGYNQALCFAEGLGESLELPVWTHLLEKTSDTDSQTRKSRLARWQNVSGGFVVAADSPELAGRHVLLVDDVLTTGSTLEACAVGLLAGGAATVSVATLAAAG